MRSRLVALRENKIAQETIAVVYRLEASVNHHHIRKCVATNNDFVFFFV